MRMYSRPVKLSASAKKRLAGKFLIVALGGTVVYGCKSTNLGSTTKDAGADLPASASQAAPLPPELADNIDFIKQEASTTVETQFKQLGGIAHRDFHIKGLCAKGRMIVDPDAVGLPQAYRVGPFATKGEYALYGRFSNGFPDLNVDDRKPSVFGFGIKMLGVNGTKFQMPGSTKPANHNQDWNLATGRTFAFPNAALYREQRELGNAKFGLRHPIILANVLRGASILDQFTAASYHSQVALHYGEKYIAKFSAAPCDGNERTISPLTALRRTRDYLREGLKQQLVSGSACFLFRAQIRPADENLDPSHADWATRFPKDNPSIDWSPDVIPFTTLARIEFPQQPDIDSLQPICEAFSINPGNALQVFRPIETDTLMTARYRGAYEGSVSKRMALNGLVQKEPEAPAPGQVDSWLQATP